ncbi:MAG: NADPH:quinone oxidoreductase family protein [Hyphomonadaceae bacterium]|nr:NADPH:quinone oxidoreductase family protein [Hyphomonadaceae bacterium]
MKALLSKAPGPPESLVLEEIPAPVAGEGQLVIDVKAASVNFPDSLMIQDLYQFKPPRPFAPGGEVGGIVKAVGAGVTRFKVGDRVLAVPGHGGFAEEVAVPERGNVFAIPDAMTFEDASSLLLTYGTSQYALKQRANLKPGETLLVLGASGGVGVAAIELGKAMGATVIAGVSSPDKAAFAEAAGADKTLVYPRELDKEKQKALSEAFKQAGGGGIDVVYDAVGGDYAEPALRAMNWEGRFLVIGFPAGIPKIPLNLTLLKNCQIVGVFWGAFTQRDPKGHAANVAELFALYEQGKIKPRISARYPLARGGEAIRELMDRKASGKIVLVLD